MKTCTKCGETKPFSEFHKNLANADGLLNQCKPCRKQMAASWYLGNKETVKKSCAAWKEKNPEKAKAISVAWRADNKAVIKQKRADWYAKNTDVAKNRNDEWAKANPESARKRTAKWRALHPEKNKDSSRTSRHNRRKIKSGGRLSKGLADKLFKLQRGKCACCGLPLGNDYHLDHIMPLKLGGSNTDDNIQLLRASCNHQKSAKHPIDFMRQRGFLL